MAAAIVSHSAAVARSARQLAPIAPSPSPPEPLQDDAGSRCGSGTTDWRNSRGTFQQEGDETRFALSKVNMRGQHDNREIVFLDDPVSIPGQLPRIKPNFSGISPAGRRRGRRREHDRSAEAACQLLRQRLVVVCSRHAVSPARPRSPLLLPAQALAGAKEKVAALAPSGLVLVIDEKGNELIAQNTEKPFVPASVTKIVTLGWRWRCSAATTVSRPAFTSTRTAYCMCRAAAIPS